mmetsp:Transcript_41399/g.63111  ORF Transcript_41399/g.63111 Transcript_41399/m.63111 type:complete len:329 (+) Transcript_41399:1432-2418(+)
MVLFYCLFLCIFYKNPFIVEFLRTLIYKINFVDMKKQKKFDFVLGQIDTHGLEHLRTIGESINTKLYHVVLYQAFDDKLKVIYSKIIRVLKELQLRDKDSAHLLNMRDFDLIKLICTNKFSRKIHISSFFEIGTPVAFSYRYYTPAYFQEIVLEPSNEVEQRSGENYQERFLVTPTAIYQVLSMYSKKDYMDNFLRMDDIHKLSKAQIIDLFTICIRHDAFKLGFQLYCRFLKGPDINRAILRTLTISLRDSIKFMEIKLFFIHEHFDTFDVEGLSKLVDILLLTLKRTRYHLIPVLSCYNPVKVALMIYKVSYRIEQLKIYSLITKC